MSGKLPSHVSAYPDRSSATVLFAVSIIATSIVLAPVVLLSVLFFFGLGVSPATFVVGLLLGLLLPLVFLPRDSRLLKAYAIVLLVAAIAMPLLATSWDNTNDSLTYHIPGTIELASGTNPVYSELENFWANHHPKASWLFSAGVYQLSGNLEATKVINVLAMLACFGFAGAFFLSISGLPRVASYLLAALLALNPVSLVQLDTHYVDGLFSNLALLLILIAITLDMPSVFSWIPRRPLGVLAFGSAVLIINLKFTGLVFVCVLLLLGVARTLQTRRKVTRQDWRCIALVLAAIGLGVLVVGFSSYVTNLARYGHPFYPVFGADLSKIPDAPDARQRPVPYQDKAAPVAFVMSLTEKTSTATTATMEAPYAPKNPLSVSRSEIASLTYPDPRRGGFGPLFLLSLTLSGVALVLLVRSRPEEDSGMPLSTLAYGLLLTLLLTLAMVEAWWARLAPTFFLAPVLVAAAGFSARPAKGRLLRWVSTGVLVVLCLNTLLVLGAQGFSYVNRSRTRQEALVGLESSERVQLRFANPETARVYSLAIQQRLEDTGFRVEVVDYYAATTAGWTDYPALLGEVRIP